jgi:hypothetical protein
VGPRFQSRLLLALILQTALDSLIMHGQTASLLIYTSGVSAAACPHAPHVEETGAVEGDASTPGTSASKMPINAELELGTRDTRVAVYKDQTTMWQPSLKFRGRAARRILIPRAGCLIHALIRTLTGNVWAVQ